MTPDRDFAAMRPEDILAADTSDWIAVLPLGAHEQHGPHLPFETDAIIASGVAARLAASLEPEIPATFLAVEPVGYSVEHMDYQGSLTLTFEEALKKWIGMGEKLAELGIRKFLLLNAHGGNSPLMTIVATELRIRCGTLCVATSWTRFVEAGKTITAQEKAIGIHGGDLETSVMLALAPNRVKMDLAQDFGSFQEVLMSDYKHLRAYGPHAFGWKMQDLNPLGVTGNACLASVERGEAYLAEAVDGLKELMLDIHAFDLKSLK